jgi:hypothetical protein
MAKIQQVAANRSLADWHSFSWKQFDVKNPPMPRQLHTMVTHEDCLVRAWIRSCHILIM